MNMNGTTRDEPVFSDDDIMQLARSIQPHDHERIAPPSQVWNNIVAELEVELATSEAAARARARRRWLPSPQILSIAAAAVLVVAIVAGVTLNRSGEAQTRQLAAAMMTDDGLQVPTTATAEARVLCEDDAFDSCVVEVDLTAVPDAGDADLELWVINADVTDMYSLGFVNDDRAVFALPDGVSPTDFPIVDISVEPRDGVATHSGQSVLRGVFNGA
jgi:anti-sigma-K factor RskA